MGKATLPPAYRLVALDTAESSNDEARRLAEAGAEEGTLVWVREQTAGRGRQGRDWSSPPGNLYFSLILRPDCPAGEAATLGLAAALALGEALGKLMPPLSEVHYKWPNDVLLNRRKVSGLLLEAQLDAERDAMLVSIYHDEAGEGIDAFLDKRKPEYVPE